ncbi:uncharacterized protein B0I36DRAFT_316422 [Microdochium trichocladiopsis]|uniref:Uncharacterized protein n=1 Tax=Microdochium trichocladiopsis TaxID=1682393 RepID=A0A9P8YA37_9PEZI|nr:uncharacterized protein B0I36DRAFT_316422 [Microdochium trichocladiopsis]KAH7034492.1 hypothetical protein B0I36DRAFT_316422 [Microdochium trichocladiopsis]
MSSTSLKQSSAWFDRSDSGLRYTSFSFWQLSISLRRYLSTSQPTSAGPDRSSVVFHCSSQAGDFSEIGPVTNPIKYRREISGLSIRGCGRRASAFSVSRLSRPSRALLWDTGQPRRGGRWGGERVLVVRRICGWRSGPALVASPWPARWRCKSFWVSICKGVDERRVGHRRRVCP